MIGWRKSFWKLLLVGSLLGWGLARAGSVTELEGFDYRIGKSEKITFKNKPSVVVFLSAKCPCSGSHVGHLGQLAKEFPEFNFVGIHSNQNESQELGTQYFGGLKLPFPVVRDPGAKMADQFGALKTPHVFVLNERGETVYMGPVTDSSEFGKAKLFYLKDTLVAVKTGGKIPDIQRRPLGCYIVR